MKKDRNSNERKCIQTKGNGTWHILWMVLLECSGNCGALWNDFSSYRFIIFQSASLFILIFTGSAERNRMERVHILILIWNSRYILSLGHGKCTMYGTIHQIARSFFVCFLFIWIVYSMFSRKCNFHFAWRHVRDPGFFLLLFHTKFM